MVRNLLPLKIQTHLHIGLDRAQKHTHLPRAELSQQVHRPRPFPAYSELPVVHERDLLQRFVARNYALLISVFSLHPLFPFLLLRIAMNEDDVREEEGR